jgi:UDP-N-acetylglucosamine--N-acetylmuramyl-(pentapeptide) pyrophosphoryl-undecaprenol N-acetylglucosamine transferase
MSKSNILIAAGGTGGHIYPALAIADALREAADVNVAFVGTESGLENKLVPPAGYHVFHLPIGRLNGKVSRRERITTLLKLPLAFWVSARLLRRQKPDLVLGVGGHASGPLLLVASRLGYRTAIWEPNAMPGLANRLLARFVDECWVVFPEARALLKNKNTRTAGMPIRREIEATASGGGERKKFRLLVFGGSQGARGINDAVVAMVRAGGAWLDDLEIVHQTGAGDFTRVREAYGPDLPKYPVDLREYLHDMGQQYARADLVIARSGTGTLSELAACGKAAILIPFPYAADDHQRKNAESLVARDAAVMIVQKDLTPERLRTEIDALREDPERRARMIARVRDFHVPKAAQNLATEFLGRIRDGATV